MWSGGGCGLEEKGDRRSAHIDRKSGSQLEGTKKYLLQPGGVFRQLPNSFRLTSIEFSLISQLELSLSFENFPSLQILVGDVVGMVWIGNEGTFVVVTEIRVIGGSSGVLHLLPTEKVSATGGGFAFASSALSSNRPGVRILEARVAGAVRCIAVVSWPVEPHLRGR